MARRNHYHVYVVELSKDVLYEGKFKKRNPGYIPGKPCVYVGMTCKVAQDLAQICALFGSKK